ncbi:MAG: VCBS repeat-containing protein [Anaerolineae bacterium]
MTQQDLDGDGKPDVAILSVRLLSDADTIRVYDRDGDMIATDDWRAAVDQDSDIWLFDVGNDGFAQLVIAFSNANGELRADVYSDLNKDGNVDTEIVDGQVNVVEAGVVYPVVSATVRGDWRMPDGRLNWNVQFTTDGGFLFDNPDLPAGIETLNLIRDFWLPYLTYDAQPDMEFNFHDEDHNGIPEYMLWRLFSETPPTSGALRARVWSNVGQSIPAQPSADSLWPLLAFKGEAVSGGPSYFDTPPYLEMDWSTGTLTPPLFQGYPIETGFHVHNFAPFELGKTNYANFEVSQAYYDLAEDHDGLPELHIRHRYFGSNDPMAWDVRTPISEIRYSWNQTNAPDLGWDYALGLANRQPVTAVTNFPDFSYNEVPYDQLPEWVLNSNWDISTLIAPEASRYLSTEGIYEWGPVETGGKLEVPVADPFLAANVDLTNSLMSRYLAGEEVYVDVRGTFNEDLPTGLRGEVRYTSAGQPMVYLSPLDQKLHLLHADFGIWNIDDDTLLRTENLNGDAYLDQWTIERGGQQVSRLIQAPNYLILEDGSGLTIKQVDVASATFETTPPATHAEWSALGEQLPTADEAVSLLDLRAIFDRYDGEAWSIPSATSSNIRLTETGAQFTLQTSLVDGGSDTYVILNGGTPRFEAREAPHLQVEFSSELPLESDPTTLRAATIGATVTNLGEQDIHDVPLTLWAALPDSLAIQAAVEPITLISDEQRQVWFTWTPPEAGDWSLSLTAGESSPVESALSVLGTASMRVSPVTEPTVDDFLSLDGEHPFDGRLILLFVGALAVSVLALAVLVLRVQSHDDA